MSVWETSYLTFSDMETKIFSRMWILFEKSLRQSIKPFLLRPNTILLHPLSNLIMVSKPLRKQFRRLRLQSTIKSPKSNLLARQSISTTKFYVSSIKRQHPTCQYAVLYKWLDHSQWDSKLKLGKKNGDTITFTISAIEGRSFWQVTSLLMEACLPTSPSNILITTSSEMSTFLMSLIVVNQQEITPTKRLCSDLALINWLMSSTLQENKK